MILNCTLLKICDNSNVAYVKCFNMPKNPKNHIGLSFYASVKHIRYKGKLQKGDIVKGIVARSRKENNRQTGNFLSFDLNTAILLNEKNESLGTRIFGYIPLELRVKRLLKLISISSSFM